MSTHFTSEILDNGIRVVTFDTPNSSANVLNLATLRELSTYIETITADRDTTGLIFSSAKPAIFIAGADLREIQCLTGEAELRKMIMLGQLLFNGIADLAIPTVAAIHGACLGGGYELCLACDYRIASNDHSTKIGLPETMLGLLPAWGGSTRLPRLVGFPNALDLILGGKQLAAIPSLGRGMIDAVVPREHLIRSAVQHIFKGRRSRTHYPLVNNSLVVRVIASRARVKAMKMTRGHYPAVPKALEVMVEGLSKSLTDSLTLERVASVELARTSACRNLIELFFLRERAKRCHAMPNDMQKSTFRIGDIGVIGAGVMGAGIAQWVSAHGHRVILRDINEDAVLKGMAGIGDIYRQGLRRYTFDSASARQGMDRIYPSACEVPLTRVDLVIEAAVENMEVKKQIFQRLGESTRGDAVLATNTSALSVSEIARGVSHPERVIGIHYFNPVHRMQLVEIVLGEQTSSAVTEQVLQFVQGIGKLPVVVKDSPGFLVNRVLMPYLIEAVSLFESGASIWEIDEAMRDFGMPMGPLRLIDEVGVDVALHVATHMSDVFRDRMTIPQTLLALMERGYLGGKTGLGFYIHRAQGDLKVNRRIRRVVTSNQARHINRKALQKRMVLVMVNEAARCLEEGVVSMPQDVDLAMIMGAGFAPFTGGPMRYADSVKILQVVEQLKGLAEDVHERFAPCTLLRDMAKSEQQFYVQ
ncbi:MAG: multifunctional fatty acid oxidation complex subunit alpha [Nitrospiraceae bacterium]|nr:multifunctional fatty acid oxidation complex subunit alpha [Nitrospiraceae bacterium]